MKVSEIMTHDVRIASPDMSIREVATIMAAIDSGFIPVAENDKLIGTITDRDIAIRGIAQGLGPETPARQVMTQDVKYCYANDDVTDLARNMADVQLRRMPVVDADKRLVGVVSLGDIAVEDKSDGAAEVALSGISEPSRLHH